MRDRTPRQQATVTKMIEVAGRMAMETKGIAARDIDDLGEVELTQEEDVLLAEALLHIEKAARDLQRLRGGGPST